MYTTDYREVVVRMHDGSLRVFTSLDEAVRWVNWPRIKYRRQDGRFLPGEEYSFYNTWSLPFGAPKFGYCELRDELGLLIPNWRIEEAIHRTGVRYWLPTKRLPGQRYRRPEGGHARSENIRVKGWRRKTSGRPRCQHVGAARALAEVLSNEDLGDLPCHVKVRKSTVFNPWDEERDRSDWDVKSWKRHRRNQYRERPQGRS